MAVRHLIDYTPFGKKKNDIGTIAERMFRDHHQRIERYKKYWRFFGGKHFAWDRGDDEPFVVHNFCRLIVNAHTTFLFKRGFRITIPDDEATPNVESEDRDFVRALLEETWKRNNRAKLGNEMGQMGSVTGDVFIRMSWEKEDPRYEKPYVSIDVIPSRFVFPDFDGPAGLDGKRVDSVLIIFPRYRSGEDNSDRYTRPRARPGFVDRDKELEYYAERWYRDRWIQYNPGQEPIEKKNMIGEIPIVHIPNLQVAGQFYGLSDLEDVIPLNEELNGRLTDISDVVNYQGSPVTVLTGARVSQLERGANRMWGLPENAEVKNLSLDGALSDSLKYVEMLTDAIHHLGSVPKGIFGTMDDTGRSSGSALAMRYQPILNRRADKIVTYGEGIQDINRIILKIQALMDAGFNAKFRKLEGEKYRSEVVFENPLPRDEAVELEKSRTRLDLGLSSRRRELEMQGLSQSEVDKILADAREERKEDAEFEFEFGQKLFEAQGSDEDEDEDEDDSGGGGNPNPQRGNPDQRGEKVSQAKAATPASDK